MDYTATTTELKGQLFLDGYVGFRVWRVCGKRGYLYSPNPSKYLFSYLVRSPLSRNIELVPSPNTAAHMPGRI